MQLERLGAVVRPRVGFESLDLGIALVRRWWRPLLAAWSISWLPLAVLVLALTWRATTWGLLILVWLKPLWSRIVLAVLSRTLFDRSPRARELPSLVGRAVRVDLWRGLTIGRLDPLRTFRLPVRQLERLRGVVARQRLALLVREGGGLALALGALCGLFETVWLLGLGLVVYKLIGGTLVDVFGTTDVLLLLRDERLDRALALGYVLILTVGETLFTAGGFTLYLSRRVSLEGWDLELTFRRLAARLSTAPRAAVLVVIALLASDPAGALAQSQQPAGAPSASSTHSATQPAAGADASSAGPSEFELRQAALEILRGPDFIRRENEVNYTVRRETSETQPNLRPLDFGPIGALIVGLLRAGAWVVWIAVAVGIGFAVVRATRHRRAPERPATASPAQIAGLDIRRESLPENVAAAARALWDHGERRAALSLLYRGALADLSARHAVPLEPSATEGDCLRAAARCLSADALSYLAALTAAWLIAAYAGRAPDETAGPRLIAGFAQHFGAP